MAKRETILHAAHYHDLISNVSYSNGCYTFDINRLDDIFTYQRLPFYFPSMMDHYEYALYTVLSDHILGHSKAKQVNDAITNLKYKLFSLAASHPQYGQIKISPMPKRSRAGLKFEKWNILLFENKQNKKLQCKMENIYTYFSNDKVQSIQQSRSKNKQNISGKRNDVNLLSDPVKVGQLYQHTVFLSELQYDQNKNKIFAPGLIDIDNGFDTHPFLIGSGDHINGGHALNTCLQFVNLLVTNCKKFKCVPPFVDETFVKTVNPQSSLTMYGADMQFRKYFELGPFIVRLLGLKMIKPGSSNNDFLCSMKIPFGFEVEICFEQNGIQCVVARLFVCPIFLSSAL